MPQFLCEHDFCIKFFVFYFLFFFVFMRFLGFLVFFFYRLLRKFFQGIQKECAWKKISKS